MAVWLWGLSPVISSQMEAVSSLDEALSSLGWWGSLDRSVPDSSTEADWYTTSTPLLRQWKPCLHHLAALFSPIVGLYLGATCSSGGCMVRTELRIEGGDDLKTMIQIALPLHP